MTTLALNRQATFDYTILETFEAGLKLSGPEVKALRAKNVSFKGSYVDFSSSGAPRVVSMHIGAYAPAAREQRDYNPTHTRDLLLTQKEINYLRGKTDRTGLTLVPLRLYTHGRRIKLEIGLAKGKKKYDKRESIKKKEMARSIQRGEDI